MDDLAFINKQEARLQQEILIDHKNTIMKVKQVEMKNGIDTKMTNSRQMVKKLNDIDPYETMHKQNMKEITEEQIEESLENLDYLLAQNAKPQNEKKQAYKKIAKKMDIRLDSTSPVREINSNYQQNNNRNPFAYHPDPNFAEKVVSYNEQISNIKPRSMMNESESGIVRTELLIKII